MLFRSEFLTQSILTDGIFETGAYGVPSKSQNSTVFVKVVHLVPNVQTLAGHVVGTIHLAPTTTLHFKGGNSVLPFSFKLRKMASMIDVTKCGRVCQKPEKK